MCTNYPEELAGWLDRLLLLLLQAVGLRDEARSDEARRLRACIYVCGEVRLSIAFIADSPWVHADLRCLATVRFLWVVNG